MKATSYYRLLDRHIGDDGVVTATYESTEHAQGAWNEDEQHMAPASGVICNELWAFQPRNDLRIGRISFDILGMIHAGQFQITTQMLRPGRTIELIESKMIAKGRPCIVARTWRMATSDTSDIAGIEDSAMIPCDDLPEHGPVEGWPGGYIASLSARLEPGHRPGKGGVWLTNPYEMVEGVETPDFVRLMGMVDTMNGVYPRLFAQEAKVGYPNLDLQIHLYRLPTGKRLGLQGTQQYGRDGIGLTSALLHDADGPFGHAEQILTLRRL